MTEKRLRRVWWLYLYRPGNANLRRLAEHYYQYVRNIAAKMSSQFDYKVSADDLTSYGVDGLYKAIQRYDPEKCTAFTTYAYIRVRGAMLDGMRKDDFVPRSVRLRQSKIESTRNRLRSEKGSSVRDEDVLDELGIDPKEFCRNQGKYKALGFSSIETSSNSDIDSGDNKKDFNSYLTSVNEPTPDSNFLKREFLNKLLGKNFTQLERKLVYFYYYKSLTMNQIAEKLGLTESRISQMHQEILGRLRERTKLNPEYFSKDLLPDIKQ